LILSRFKAVKKIALVLLIIPLVFAFVNTVDPIDKTAGLIRRANVTELAKSFAPSFELSILDDENVYTPQPAAQKLTEFFKKNPPKSVRVLHRIVSNRNYRFAVIILTTENGNFRTSFSLKDTGGQFLLNELRIETEKTK
jgi:hypothetical protein